MSRAFASRAFKARAFKQRAFAGIGTRRSVHKGLAVHVRDVIAGMADAGTLPEISSLSVLQRKIPYVQDFGTAEELVKEKNKKRYGLPGIIVCYGPQETIEVATNEQDDIGYPILIVLIDADASIDDSEDNKQLCWREALVDQFRTRGLTISDPSTRFHTCRVEPGPIVDWNVWASQNQFLSTFILRFITRRPRGTN